MRLDHDNSSSKIVLALDETLEAASGSQFRAMVREALAHNPKELVLDCKALTYIDSTGLGLLTLARSEASKTGCTVSMNNVSNGHTRKVLELVKFDQMFQMSFVD